MSLAESDDQSDVRIAESFHDQRALDSALHKKGPQAVIFVHPPPLCAELGCDPELNRGLSDDHDVVA